MKAQWKRVFVKTTVWLITEIILNLLGLDNLADYNDFILEQKKIMAMSHLFAPTLTNKLGLYWLDCDSAFQIPLCLAPKL
ncbi:MAG: hypothetical protein AB1861_16835 [Cyanobacteriota bacterium]